MKQGQEQREQLSAIRRNRASNNANRNQQETCAYHRRKQRYRQSDRAGVRIRWGHAAIYYISDAQALNVVAQQLRTMGVEAMVIRADVADPDRVVSLFIMNRIPPEVTQHTC